MTDVEAELHDLKRRVAALERIMAIELPPLIPPSRKPDPEWTKIAERLRRMPGDWQLVGRHSASQITRIKSGKLAAFRPAGSFDAVGRDKGARGRIDVYVRFVGDQ
jgi:hypothetical protein